MARKSGILTADQRSLAEGSARKTPSNEVDELVNELRPVVQSSLDRARRSACGLRKLRSSVKRTLRHTRSRRLAEPRSTFPLPGIRRPLGAEHPVIKTMHEIVSVFQKLGYSVAEGPVVETDYYNFEALNFPPNHPARDTQDTLFIAGQQSKPQRERLLLRTHTSPVQIRTMEKMKPPMRIVIPGTVHRNDPPDASHSPMFHQIEGLAVDTNITFGDLKGTLDHAMKALFGSCVKTHFRPSFFPFTEPSAEMYGDLLHLWRQRQARSGPCRPCKQTGWIEILGCGMVDPERLRVREGQRVRPEKGFGICLRHGRRPIAILEVWGG